MINIGFTEKLNEVEGITKNHSDSLSGDDLGNNPFYSSSDRNEDWEMDWDEDWFDDDDDDDD